jgi:hypothetical protein
VSTDGPRRTSRRERMIMLSYYEQQSAVGVPHDKQNRHQAWMLEQKYLKAEIEHNPPGSDWPRVILKITELGRAALEDFRHSSEPAQ